jgi:hypothetical protein
MRTACPQKDLRSDITDFQTNLSRLLGDLSLSDEAAKEAILLQTGG